MAEEAWNLVAVDVVTFEQTDKTGGNGFGRRSLLLSSKPIPEFPEFLQNIQTGQDFTDHAAISTCCPVSSATTASMSFPAAVREVASWVSNRSTKAMS